MRALQCFYALGTCARRDLVFIGREFVLHPLFKLTPPLPQWQLRIGRGRHAREPLLHLRFKRARKVLRELLGLHLAPQMFNGSCLAIHRNFFKSLNGILICEMRAVRGKRARDGGNADQLNQLRRLSIVGRRFEPLQTLANFCLRKSNAAAGMNAATMLRKRARNVWQQRLVRKHNACVALVHGACEFAIARHSCGRLIGWITRHFNHGILNVGTACETMVATNDHSKMIKLCGLTCGRKNQRVHGHGLPVELRLCKTF